MLQQDLCQRHSQINVVTLCPGISCPPFKVTGAMTNTSDVLYDTYVNVSCHPGFQFSDDQTSIVTRCLANRSWSPQPINCTRAYAMSSASDYFTKDYYSLYIVLRTQSANDTYKTAKINFSFSLKMKIMCGCFAALLSNGTVPLQQVNSSAHVAVFLV